jgi:hypothetical protein
MECCTNAVIRRQIMRGAVFFVTLSLLTGINLEAQLEPRSSVMGFVTAAKVRNPGVMIHFTVGAVSSRPSSRLGFARSETVLGRAENWRAEITCVTAEEQGVVEGKVAYLGGKIVNSDLLPDTERYVMLVFYDGKERWVEEPPPGEDKFWAATTDDEAELEAFCEVGPTVISKFGEWKVLAGDLLIHD